MTEQPVLDLTHLRGITDGDTELEARLFELFCATADRCIHALSTSKPSDTTWHDVCHELKGASANIGAQALAQACRQAEQANSPESAQQAMSAITQLRDATFQAIKAL